MTKQNEPKQILYSTWGSEPSEHRNYFGIVGDIATFIGRSLDGVRCHLQGDKLEFFKTGNILVHQSKEKFGSVRVYCTLALRELVEDKFKTYAIDPTKTPEFPSVDSPEFEEFYSQAMIKDAQLYRSVYYAAKRMWPQYWLATSNDADYPEFLFETEKAFNESSFASSRPGIKKLVSEACWYDWSGPYRDG